VHVYSDMFRSEPGFRWLRLGDAIDRFLIDESETNRTIVARVMAEHFVTSYSVSHRDDLLQHVEVMVEIADSLVARAFVANPDGDEFFIGETSRLLTEYLGEYLARTVEEAEERERLAQL
jgi:hypothetical protein